MAGEGPTAVELRARRRHLMSVMRVFNRRGIRATDDGVALVREFLGTYFDPAAVNGLRLIQCRHAPTRPHDVSLLTVASVPHLATRNIVPCRTACQRDSPKSPKVRVDTLRNAARRFLNRKGHGEILPDGVNVDGLEARDEDGEELAESQLELDEEREAAFGEEFTSEPYAPSSDRPEGGRSVSTGMRAYVLSYLWDRATSVASFTSALEQLCDDDKETAVDVLHLCGCGLPGSDSVMATPGYATHGGCVEPTHLILGSASENRDHRAFHHTTSGLNRASYLAVLPHLGPQNLNCGVLF